MEPINYLELANTKTYLSILPNELLISIYDYIDINLNPLIKFIKELSLNLTNEEIFNYFYKWDSRRINSKFSKKSSFECIYVNKRLKLFPKYNLEIIYKIPFNYRTINSTLDNIKLVPLFYRPIQKFTTKYDGVTMFEKHELENILNSGYTNSYNQRFIYKKLKNGYGYTCRESVLLTFLFCKIKYIFTGTELKFYLTRTNKITKKLLTDYGFKHILINYGLNIF